MLPSRRGPASGRGNSLRGRVRSRRNPGSAGARETWSSLRRASRRARRAPAGSMGPGATLVSSARGEARAARGRFGSLARSRGPARGRSLYLSPARQTPSDILSVPSRANSRLSTVLRRPGRRKRLRGPRVRRRGARPTGSSKERVGRGTSSSSVSYDGARWARTSKRQLDRARGPRGRTSPRSSVGRPSGAGRCCRTWRGFLADRANVFSTPSRRPDRKVCLVPFSSSSTYVKRAARW